MSKYSDYIKEAKDKDLKFFYGDDLKHVSNKYITFKHYKDDDNIILVTNNIATVKGNYVLVVDNNKAVYLKDWQVRAIYNYFENFNGYAVKLNKKYFKVYTFKSDFNQFLFLKENSWEDLVAIAKEQDEANIAIAQG